MAEKGLRRSTKRATRGRSKEKRPTQSRGGVKGGFPLAGSRDSVPCGVWGNAPTVSRQTNPKEAANKGAGSEASLPVTLRVLRRAPKLLFRPTMLCRARWARPNCWSFRHSCAVNQECFFPNAGISPLRRRQKGNETGEACVRPLETFGLPCCLIFTASF